MEQAVLFRIAALAEQAAAVKRSIEYIRENLGKFLKKNERVLICFPQKEDACCYILEQAVLGCGGVPIWIGEDQRWIAILKKAFTSKCNCIIGPPLLLLGLSKVAKQMGTPLFARNVLLSGYPSPKWIVDAVEKGLDCKSWGCYDPGLGAVIGGFSCGHNLGVHIRDDEYGVEIVDDAGKLLPMGEAGNVVLYPKEEPSLRLNTKTKGRLEKDACPCGCSSPRLVDIDIEKGDTETLSDIGEKLLYWSSILDCRVERTECGLDLEAVVFQGEKLPKFPSCAKMVIRPWNAETDRPFDHHGEVKKRYLLGLDH